MKTILFCMLALSVIACGPDPGFRYAYTVSNEAGFDVRLSCTGCQTVTITSGASKEVQTNTLFADYLMEAVSATVKKIDWEETALDKFKITSYEFDVEYRVTGDATNLEVSVKNGAGVVEKYTSVLPPVSYQFRDFSGSDLYVSAKKTGAPGSVLVQIYYKDKVIVGDMTQVNKGTATASTTVGD